MLYNINLVLSILIILIFTFGLQACNYVVQYLSNNIKHIRECLDAKNANLILVELGIKFHRIIYDHLLQFTYNSAGRYL